MRTRFQAHLGVAVVTVGGKKDFGNLFNPSQKHGKILLWRKHSSVQGLTHFCQK